MRMEEFKKWMRRSGEYSISTINHTLSYVRYIEIQLGLDLDVATVEEISDALYEMRESGRPLSTLQNWVKYINRYLEFRGLDIKIKYFKETRNDDEYFYVPTDEEAKKIMAVKWVRPDVNARNRAMIHLLFATGIRIGELIALNWSDIELKTLDMPLLHIRHGKGAKKRTVPVPPRVVNMLFEYKKYRINSDPNAIFTTPVGRISHAYARKICKETGIRAGVPQFHAHAARHWRAIKWLKEGVNLETIRRLLGHESLKTTQRYLRRLQMEWSFEEVKQKDTFFGRWVRAELKLGSEYIKEEGGEI